SGRFHQLLSRCSVFPSQHRKNNRSLAVFANRLSCRLAHFGAASRGGRVMLGSSDRFINRERRVRRNSLLLPWPGRALTGLGAARLLVRYRESREFVDRMPEARDRRLPVGELLHRRDAGKSVPQPNEACDRPGADKSDKLLKGREGSVLVSVGCSGRGMRRERSYLV